MMNIPRRAFLKTLGSLSILFSMGCRKENSGVPLIFDPGTGKNPETPPALEPNTELDAGLPQQRAFSTLKQEIVSSFEMTNPSAYRPGYLAMLQGPTSDTEALFNILIPRFKKYSYAILDSNGRVTPLEPYDRIQGPNFFHIVKLKASNLELGMKYRLRVIDKYKVDKVEKELIVDERSFAALDVQKKDPKFALISCMSDDYRFDEVIDPMWDRLRTENPDFLFLIGDMVYVDAKEFVDRKNVTELDLWQRYVDAFRRIPLYHRTDLVPTFSVWDDHDFGVNNGDRSFKIKEASLRFFKGFFGGVDLPGVWTQCPVGGVGSVLTAFGQRFFLLDDRTYRQPDLNQTEKESYGHWGQTQHEWLVESLGKRSVPTWLINGNQFLKGAGMEFNESVEANHPAEFEKLMVEIKTFSFPVVFASGDIHLSEIMNVPIERTGYQTFEISSSCMHSYVGEGWENPLRMDGAYCREFNFNIIRSQAKDQGFDLDISCIGLAAEPYYNKKLQITL